jgi:choline dehydrogenase
MSQVTIAKGRRQSTAFCYLDPARGRRNLTIEQGRPGRDADPRRQGLRRRALCRERRKREARAAREVIVCSGSINSPKLLELSGIGQGQRCARSASCRCTS